MDGDHTIWPVELRLTSPIHLTGYAYWRAHKPSLAMLPSRSDIDPLEMPRTLLPWINLIEVHRDHGDLRYRHRLVGTGIVDMRERDGTGNWFHDLYDKSRLMRVRRTLDQVVLDGHPRVVEDDLANTGKAFRTMHSLAMPLASDGFLVDMILAVVYYD